jgi:hypothetical protein
MDSVLDEVMEQTFRVPSFQDRKGEIQRTVQWAVARTLMGLADSPSVSPPGVRSRAEAHLRAVALELAAPRPGELPEEAAHRQALAGAITRFLDRGMLVKTGEAGDRLVLPPGSPIGAAEELCSFH